MTSYLDARIYHFLWSEENVSPVHEFPPVYEFVHEFPEPNVRQGRRQKYAGANPWDELDTGDDQGAAIGVVVARAERRRHKRGVPLEAVGVGRDLISTSK